MRGVNASARPAPGRQEVLILRLPILLLAAVLAVAIALAGCPKPADQGAGPAPPTSKTPSGKFGGKAPPASVTLTDPDGQPLVLVPTTPDPEFLKGLGLTAYPKATPYALDVDATVEAGIQAEKKKPDAKMTESAEKALRAEAKSVFTVKNAFFETEDSLEDVHNWATENLKGWTVGEIKDKKGTKQFALTKDDLKDKIECGVADINGKRYMMVVETSSAGGASAGKATPAPKAE